MSAENEEPPATNGAQASVDPEGFPSVSGAETPSDAPESILERSSDVVKRTYNLPLKPRGRPSKYQKKAEKKDRAKNPPPEGPPVKSWGGKRKGAGRPRRNRPAPKKMTMVRMDRALAAKLDSLPRGERSEYLRQAVELMTDIQPPEKFLASGRKKREASGASSTQSL
jgi:hypothetical protein